MQIQIRPAVEKNGHYVDHICKTLSEFMFLQSALKDHQHSSYNQQTLTITTLVIVGK